MVVQQRAPALARGACTPLQPPLLMAASGCTLSLPTDPSPAHHLSCMPATLATRRTWYAPVPTPHKMSRRMAGVHDPGGAGRAACVRFNWAPYAWQQHACTSRHAHRAARAGCIAPDRSACCPPAHKPPAPPLRRLVHNARPFEMPEYGECWVVCFQGARANGL